MAQKRMFSLQIVDTDKFMDMSTGAQALYFHLGMHGDDDGFVSSPKKIARSVGCNDDDLRLLAAKGYIIPFESGVIVITDWGINNTLKNDRYHKTVFQAERAMLTTDKSGRYALGTNLEPEWNQNGSNLEPEPNLTQPNLTEPNRECEEPPVAAPTRSPAPKRFVPPTVEQVTEYVKQRGSKVDPQGFIDFYAAKGWKIGKTPMKDWKAACRNSELWERWEKPRDTRGQIKTAADYDKGEDFFSC